MISFKLNMSILLLGYLAEFSSSQKARNLHLFKFQTVNLQLNSDTWDPVT